MSLCVEPFAMIRTRLENIIMEALTFPFCANEHCQPDGSKHEIPDATFLANGKFYVFYDIRLFPGITFRGLKASAGDLNILSPEVEIEVEIPTIGGYLYVISGNPGEKPEISKGSFKLNYGMAIAKGIICSSTLGNRLFITNMVIDFEQSKDPRVTVYPDDETKIDYLDGKDSIIPNVLWPCVTPILYWILRDKLSKIGDGVNWQDIVPGPQFPLYKRMLHSRTTWVLNEIITRLEKQLKKTVQDGRIKMPDIETMMVHSNDENIWGKFSATSGWLGNVAKMRVNGYPQVHMKSENELEFVGTIRFVDLKHCYDEYSMKSKFHTEGGKIENILGGNDTFVTIKIKRKNGELVKEGRFEFINANDVYEEITGLDHFHWLERHIIACMYGDLRAKGIPAFKKIFEKCLNQVLEEFDSFFFWDTTIVDNNEIEEIY